MDRSGPQPDRPQSGAIWLKRPFRYPRHFSHPCNEPRRRSVCTARKTESFPDTLGDSTPAGAEMPPASAEDWQAAIERDGFYSVLHRFEQVARLPPHSAQLHCASVSFCCKLTASEPRQEDAAARKRRVGVLSSVLQSLPRYRLEVRVQAHECLLDGNAGFAERVVCLVVN